jgi:hypothetical protein
MSSSVYRLSNGIYRLSSGYVTAYENGKRLFGQPLMKMEGDCLAIAYENSVLQFRQQCLTKYDNSVLQCTTAMSYSLGNSVLQCTTIVSYSLGNSVLQFRQ